MKSIISYLNEGADLRKEEKELIDKYLGSYASKVTIKQTFTRQRMKEGLVINFYCYVAKDRADVSKFSGLLYDLLKHMDDTLPDKIKGKYNYVKLKKDETKEDFVKAKEEQYDGYYKFLKDQAENGKGFLKQSAIEDLKSGKSSYTIYFDLH